MAEFKPSTFLRRYWNLNGKLCNSDLGGGRIGHGWSIDLESIYCRVKSKNMFQIVFHVYTTIPRIKVFVFTTVRKRILIKSAL